jgi:diguanylate cyclase (GGDEF)-like protein
MSSKTNPAKVTADILVVEDSHTQAEALRFVLEEKGYRVTIVRDGRQALACLNGHQPTLIISDIIMPEMDGYQLCQRVKADERTRNIRVILLTSLYEAADVFQGLACGADSFITKPYEAKYLLKQIEHMLNKLSSTPDARHTVELEIPLDGKTISISANPQRIISLFLSIYEEAIHRNTELLRSQDELRVLNENLENLVEERTVALSAEVAESERLQAELRELSLHDELTGLLNRRGFMTLAEQHRRLALRTRQEFVLLYMDMDGLKHINDAYGHDAGDQALMAVARAMQQSFRKSDILARMGGDEFAILFANSDAASAKVIITRLKESLKRINPSDQYALSLSVGMAYFNQNNQAAIEDLLKQADAEMYTQKEQSRKRA